MFLAGSSGFKGHYRRSKTNKAPRKRTFIANMEKSPHALSDALAASASTGVCPFADVLEHIVLTFPRALPCQVPGRGAQEAEPLFQSEQAQDHGLMPLLPAVGGLASHGLIGAHLDRS